MKFRTIVLAVVLSLLISASLFAGIVKTYDPLTGKEDLMLLGFGEFTFHAMSVSGNKAAFEASNPWLNDDYTANYRTSLMANGHLNKYLFLNGTAVVDSRIGDEYRTNDPSNFRLQMSMNSTEPLWDGWRFTGYGKYDPQRQWEYGNLDTRLLTQPQEPAKLELLAKLESDKYGFIEAGSLQPSFKNSKFTISNRSLFGGYADVHKGALGLEAVGGKLEGKQFREGTAIGIKANGTSGPYDLTNVPVTRGSEVVKIETRDRFDESTVLSSQILVKDVDYNIDYVRGRVLLHLPVSSEDIAGNPIYVVVSYDFQRTANDELLGSRVHVMPSEDLSGSVSYLHRFEDDRLTGAGEDEPDDLVAGDAAFALGKVGRGYFEIANSKDSSGGEDSWAYRAGVKLTPGQRMTFNADFQEIEDQYKSFSNTDLNPQKNQRRVNLDGSFKLDTKQDVYARFAAIRGLEAGGEYNNYPGERDEKIYQAGYRNKYSRGLNFDIMAERRDVQNATVSTGEDNSQNRLIFDVKGEREKTSFLGLFGYGFHYEYIAFDNKVSGSTDDNVTNQAAATISSIPVEGTRFALTQKIRLRDMRDQGIYDDREDGTYFTANIQPHHNVNTLTTIEYKRFTVPGSDLQFWQDESYRTDRAGNFAVEYIPVRLIKALGKVGRYEMQRNYADSTVVNTNDFVMGQVTLFPKHHLSFGVETEFRRINRDATIDSRDKVWDLGVRVNGNRDRFTEFTLGMIRRWQLVDQPPVPEIKTVSYILLASGSLSFGHGFFGRGAIKAILLKESMDDEKTYTQVEVGYENARYYRVSIGYERIEGDNDDDPSLDYRGHGVFLRILGKL